MYVYQYYLSLYLVHHYHYHSISPISYHMYTPIVYLYIYTYEPRKKNRKLITFHYTGWFIGILIMACYNPQYNWVVQSPMYSNQPGFVFYLARFCTSSGRNLPVGTSRIPPKKRSGSVQNSAMARSSGASRRSVGSDRNAGPFLVGRTCRVNQINGIFSGIHLQFFWICFVTVIDLLKWLLFGDFSKTTDDVPQT